MSPTSGMESIGHRAIGEEGPGVGDRCLIFMEAALRTDNIEILGVPCFCMWLRGVEAEGLREE